MDCPEGEKIFISIKLHGRHDGHRDRKGLVRQKLFKSKEPHKHHQAPSDGPSCEFGQGDPKDHSVIDNINMIWDLFFRISYPTF